MATPYTLNQYPWWKYLLIGLVILWGLIFALPNLFGEDPAVQISGARANIAIDPAFQDRVAALLDAEKLPHKRLELEADRLLVRFTDPEEQLKAADILKDRLGRDYIVALNLASSEPGFLRALGLNPMYLGLDLRGGVHFLMQVDMDATVKQVEDSYVEDIRAHLRAEKVLYASVGRATNGGGIRVEFKDGAERDKAAQVLHKQLPNLQQSEPDPLSLKLTLGEPEIREKRAFALQQNITTLRNRVNELGVAEPIIQQQGNDRIVVQLPGVQDTARAKEILGATATLEFRLADEENDWTQAAATGRIPLNSRLYKDREGRPVLLQKRVMLTGDSIVDAASGLDQQSGGPAVFVTLDGKGAKRFEDATKDNIGKRMGVVFIENKTETKRVDGELKKTAYTVEEVINLATIRDRLGRRFQITGLDSTREARDLALLLRAGALVILNDLDETLARFHAARLLDDGYADAMSGEPALTAARVLASQDQAVALYAYAMRHGGTLADVVSECLRSLTDMPTALVPSLLTRHADSTESIVLVGLFDLLLNHREGPLGRAFLDDYLREGADPDAYRYLAMTVIARGDELLVDTLLTAARLEQDPDKVAIMAEALALLSTPEADEIRAQLNSRLQPRTRRRR